MQRPKRTFGLSIAIIASVVLFSIIPLLQLLRLLTVRARLEGMGLEVGGSDPLFVGSNYTNLSDFDLLVRCVLGAVFLVIAALAWRGKPSVIRFVMIAAVLLLTIVTIGFAFVPLINQPSLEAGLDSGDSARRWLLISQIGGSVLIPLYVVWYLNRGPARAFYRGYYLPDPRETVKDE